MAPQNAARDFIIYQKPSDIPTNLKYVRSCVAKSKHQQRKQQRQQSRKHKELSDGEASTTISNKPASSAADSASLTTQHNEPQSPNTGTDSVQQTTLPYVAPTADTYPIPWIDPCQISFMGNYATPDFESWKDWDRFGTSFFDKADGMVGQSMGGYEFQNIESRRASRVEDGAVRNSIQSELSQGLFSSVASPSEPNPRQSHATMNEMMARFPHKWAEYIRLVLASA